MESSEFLTYFITQGPFAALFVWLLWHTQKRNKEREDQMVAQNKEREDRLYATLNEFAQRYDIVIEKLDEIKTRLPSNN